MIKFSTKHLAHLAFCGTAHIVNHFESSTIFLNTYLKPLHSGFNRISIVIDYSPSMANLQHYSGFLSLPTPADITCVHRFVRGLRPWRPPVFWGGHIHLCALCPSTLPLSW